MQKPSISIKSIASIVCVVLMASLGNVLAKEVMAFATGGTRQTSISPRSWSTKSLKGFKVETPFEFKKDENVLSQLPTNIYPVIDNVYKYDGKINELYMTVVVFNYNDKATVDLKKSMQGSMEAALKSINSNAKAEYSITPIENDKYKAYLGKAEIKFGRQQIIVRSKGFQVGNQLSTMLLFYESGTVQPEDVGRIALSFDALEQ